MSGNGTTPWLGGQHSTGTQPLATALRRIESIAPAAGFPPGNVMAREAPRAADAELARERAAHEHELATARMHAAEEGRAAGLAETAVVRDQLATAAAAFDARRLALVTADAALLVDLALEVAGALLGHALAADRAALTDTVEQALAAAGDAAQPVLRVHHADAAAIAPHAPAGVKIEADASLGPGEIRVETDRAILDGTAAARLAAVREHLIAALESSPRSPSSSSSSGSSAPAPASEEEDA